MRHYGAPCRLIDFTYSFYVALYFALKKVTSNQTAAVWAVNQKWLREKFNSSFPTEKGRTEFRFHDPKDYYDHFLIDKPYDFVAPVNPFRQNQRLTAQQGIFLSPGNISKTFMENLISGDALGERKKVIRIPIEGTVKTDVIRYLRRMNINSATLYPDLQGFAEYLSDWFYLPMAFLDEDLREALMGQCPDNRHI